MPVVEADASPGPVRDDGPAATQHPPNLYSQRCASRQTLDLIADKWTVLVVRALQDGPHRYEALRRRIQGVSKRMLTQTLRDLEHNGLVLRFDRGSVPPHVEYSLTPLGSTLGEPISALAEWSQDHRDDVQRARSAAGAPPLRPSTRPIPS